MSAVRYAVIWLSAATAVVFAVSYAFDVPYIYTVTGIAGFVFIGHFVTLDDDAPGGWSNPDESMRVWSGSLFGLFLKLVVLAILLLLLFAFPEITKYGT